MTKNIAIKDAIIMIGHADPETKIAGWLAIGGKVAEARKRFGVSRGRGNGERGITYRQWLDKEGIASAMSESSAAAAGQLFERRRDLNSRRREFKIPLTWTNPKELLRALDDVDAGREPAKYKTRKGLFDTTKDGDVKTWSDGQPGAFYSEGIAFSNMMTRLPRMNKADQLKAVGAFFGTSSHSIKATRLANSSIRVVHTLPKDAPVDRAVFDITIKFHKGAQA
jgi:hypothetical protein